VKGEKGQGGRGRGRHAMLAHHLPYKQCIPPITRARRLVGRGISCPRQAVHLYPQILESDGRRHCRPHNIVALLLPLAIILFLISAQDAKPSGDRRETTEFRHGLPVVAAARDAEGLLSKEDLLDLAVAGNKGLRPHADLRASAGKDTSIDTEKKYK
jgi:hypothetical protein